MTVFFRVSSGDLSQGATQWRYKTKSPPEIPKAPQSIRLTDDRCEGQKSKHFYPVLSTPSPTAAEAKLETQSWVNSPLSRGLKAKTHIHPNACAIPISESW